MTRHRFIPVWHKDYKAPPQEVIDRNRERHNVTWRAPKKISGSPDRVVLNYGNPIRYKESPWKLVNVFLATAALYEAVRRKLGFGLALVLFVPVLLAVLFLAWSTPSSQTTGDLITAAIWNQNVVDNVQFLHDRVTRIYGNILQATPAIGDHLASGNISTANRHAEFMLPVDFASVSDAQLAVIAGANGTWNYDLDTDYGPADGTGAYNASSETLASQSLATTANYMYQVDISAVLSGVGAEDVIGLKITQNSGPAMYAAAAWIDVLLD